MPTIEKEHKKEENEKSITEIQVKFLLILTSISLGSFSYIPGSTLVNLGKKLSIDMFYMPSIFASRAIGYIIGILFGTYIFEYLLHLKEKYLVFFASMLGLCLMSFAISVVSTLFGLLLTFCASGTCMATLVTGVDAICLFSEENADTPFVQTLSVFYALGSIFAPVFSRNYEQEKNISSWHYETIATDTVAAAYGTFGGGIFIVSLMWFLQYWFSRFNAPTIREPDRKFDDISSVLKYLAIYNTSMLCFFGLSICYSYVLLIPTYCIFEFGMTQNEASDFMTLFLGISAFSRLISDLISERVELHKTVLIGIIVVLFGITIMFLEWTFFGDNYWSAHCFIAFGSGPMFPCIFTWFTHELRITPRRILVLHLVGALSELVVPSILGVYILKNDSNGANRNGFLLTVALIYLLFLLLQYILVEALHKKRTLAFVSSRTLREVALSDMSPAERSLSTERFTFGAGLGAPAEEQNAKNDDVNHEEIIQRLSNVKHRIRIQNRNIRLTLHTLVYSGSQLK